MRVLILAILFLTFLSPAFANEDYICPMHPHVHGSKGEYCPICGMELVPASPQETPPQNVPAEAINISPAYMQALGVKSEKAVRRDFGKTVHSFGRIVPSTRDEYQVSLRKGGWIRDLKTSAVGDTVKKGDVLFTFYSPELIAIQLEYLAGLKSGFRAATTDQRLRLFGMDEQAIEWFKKQNSIMEDVPFHAPADGVVTVLNARKGAYVAEGSVLLTLQDYSKVWGDVHILLKDMQFISVGTPAKVTVAQTGESVSTVIDYIHPVTDPDNLEAMARLVLDNSAGNLKTGAPVDVVFTGKPQSRLAVPEEAVLYSGMGAYVVEDLSNGNFHPVMVKTGISSDGLTEITSGLSEGQYVVTSGQFMLDAESHLRGGMTNMDMKDTGESHAK
jgi:membrane fusion protein, copper/silver efflux system